jgi:hypothetical protein
VPNAAARRQRWQRRAHTQGGGGGGDGAGADAEGRRETRLAALCDRLGHLCGCARAAEAHFFGGRRPSGSHDAWAPGTNGKRRRKRKEAAGDGADGMQGCEEIDRRRGSRQHAGREREGSRRENGTTTRGCTRRAYSLSSFSSRTASRRFKQPCRSSSFANEVTVPHRIRLAPLRARAHRVCGWDGRGCQSCPAPSLCRWSLR